MNLSIFEFPSVWGDSLEGGTVVRKKIKLPPSVVENERPSLVSGPYAWTHMVRHLDVSATYIKATKWKFSKIAPSSTFPAASVYRSVPRVEALPPYLQIKLSTEYPSSGGESCKIYAAHAAMWGRCDNALRRGHHLLLHTCTHDRSRYKYTRNVTKA